MSSTTYFYFRFGKEYGPFTKKELHVKRVQRSTLIRRVDDANWIELFKHPDFASELESFTEKSVYDVILHNAKITVKLLWVFAILNVVGFGVQYAVIRYEVAHELDAVDEDVELFLESKDGDIEIFEVRPEISTLRRHDNKRRSVAEYTASPVRDMYSSNKLNHRVYVQGKDGRIETVYRRYAKIGADVVVTELVINAIEVNVELREPYWEGFGFQPLRQSYHIDGSPQYQYGYRDLSESSVDGMARDLSEQLSSYFLQVGGATFWSSAGYTNLATGTDNQFTLKIDGNTPSRIISGSRFDNTPVQASLGLYFRNSDDLTLAEEIFYPFGDEPSRKGRINFQGGDSRSTYFESYDKKFKAYFNIREAKSNFIIYDSFEIQVENKIKGKYQSWSLWIIIFSATIYSVLVFLKLKS